MSLVQYIILRHDLSAAWNKGSTIAQACHAVTKCLIQFKNDDLVKQYTSPDNLENMTKIVLSAKDESELLSLKLLLQENAIDFVEWIELPEKIITSIVLKPQYKSKVEEYLKSFKLFK